MATLTIVCFRALLDALRVTRAIKPMPVEPTDPAEKLTLKNVARRIRRVHDALPKPSGQHLWRSIDPQADEWHARFARYGGYLFAFLGPGVHGVGDHGVASL